VPARGSICIRSPFTRLSGEPGAFVLGLREDTEGAAGDLMTALPESAYAAGYVAHVLKVPCPRSCGHMASPRVGTRHAECVRDVDWKRPSITMATTAAIWKT
jgi:hypothetical protein